MAHYALHRLKAGVILSVGGQDGLFLLDGGIDDPPAENSFRLSQRFSIPITGCFEFKLPGIFVMKHQITAFRARKLDDSVHHFFKDTAQIER